MAGEWFSLRDLMGGENFDWHETPMQDLFEAYRGRDGKECWMAIKNGHKRRSVLLIRNEKGGVHSKVSLG